MYPINNYIQKVKDNKSHNESMSNIYRTLNVQTIWSIFLSHGYNDGSVNRKKILFIACFENNKFKEIIWNNIPQKSPVNIHLVILQSFTLGINNFLITIKVHRLLTWCFISFRCSCIWCEGTIVWLDIAYK